MSYQVSKKVKLVSYQPTSGFMGLPPFSINDDFVAIYIAQRNASGRKWGWTNGDPPEANIILEDAKNYAGQWITSASLATTLGFATDSNFKVETINAARDRLSSAINDNNFMTVYPNQILINPGSFWKKIADVAFNMDAVQGVPSDLKLGFDILWGTVSDTFTGVKNLITNGLDIGKYFLYAGLIFGGYIVYKESSKK